jgi:hypothetical protein
VLFDKISYFSLREKKVIVLGDLNGRIGTLNTTPTEQRASMDRTVNSRGSKIIQDIQEAGLKIGNGAVSGDLMGAVTFISESVVGPSVVDFYSSLCEQFL